MACASNVMVSATSYVEWTPCGTAADETDVILDLTPDSSATVTGTFRIWINGKVTAPITYNATIATLVSSVQTALDAVTWGTGITYTAATAETTRLGITADQVGYNDIRAIVENISGAKTINATYKTRYIAIGTETFNITPELMNYSVNESVSFEDTTPLGQTETRQVVVSSDMSFDVTMYDVGQVYGPAFHAGAEGVLTIFKEGKVPGSEFLSLHAILESSDLDAPNKGKLERSFSGQRQNAYIFPPGSIYYTA